MAVSGSALAVSGCAASGLAPSARTSFGVAAYRGGEPVAAFLRRADQAMYRAKEGGRNRVCGEEQPRAQRWA